MRLSQLEVLASTPESPLSLTSSRFFSIARMAIKSKCFKKAENSLETSLEI
jgi:hypothetical protein